MTPDPWYVPRDLTPRGIATAISHLLAAEVPLENEFVILNHWR
jgi:hypothetical protein